MIKFFLGLFPQYRSLEIELDRVLALARECQNRLSVEATLCAERTQELVLCRAKAQEWEERYFAANADAQKARETVADFVSQLRFGRRIFEHAPAIPPQNSDEMKPVPKRRVQARTLVQQYEREYEAATAEYLSRQRMAAQSEREAARLPSEAIEDLAAE